MYINFVPEIFPDINRGLEMHPRALFFRNIYHLLLTKNPIAFLISMCLFQVEPAYCSVTNFQFSIRYDKSKNTK